MLSTLSPAPSARLMGSVGTPAFFSFVGDMPVTPGGGQVQGPSRAYARGLRRKDGTGSDPGSWSSALHSTSVSGIVGLLVSEIPRNTE